MVCYLYIQGFQLVMRKNKRVVKVGVKFNADTRTIEDWQISE